jgi:ATP-binding protein involved in chromosome partitioning
MTLEDEIRRRLDEIPYPGFRHSIVRYGVVQRLDIADGNVTIGLMPASARGEVNETIANRVHGALSTLAGVRSVRVSSLPSGPSSEEPSSLSRVRHIVAVSSAKGGVGKSTVAVNLAIALARSGSKVALMDADVYGPSAPLMLGTSARPHASGSKISPIERYGIEVMSMGFFLDDSSPVIWRGPMVMGLVRQFLRDVEWGSADYLIVDMPPGTGDAALTLAQQVPLAGALIVTTPQEVALADVERGIGMFRQLAVPVLGIVENMSEYVCPDCGERDELFGSGGGDALAKRFSVPLLASLPIVARVREGGDVGAPIVVSDPDHAVSKQFIDLARSVDQALAARVRQA